MRKNLKAATHKLVVILHSLGTSLATPWNDFHDDCNAIDNYDWPCDKNSFPICVPYGYSKNQPPRYPKSLKSSGIFANFVLNSKEGEWFQKDIKGVDINKMMFTFVPTLVIAWQDHRFKFCNHKSIEEMYQWFETTEGGWQNWLDVIWYPDISVENKLDMSTQGKPSKLV